VISRCSKLPPEILNNRTLSRFAQAALIFTLCHWIGYGSFELLCDLPSL